MGGALVGGCAPQTPPLHILRGQSPLKLPNFFLDFGIPKLRTFFEDFDPMWPLQRSYCLENVRILSLSILGFHQNLSKILIFISQSPPFYENPISSVRPSETQNSRFLCVHPHSGGVVGFSIIGFSSMTPPRSLGGHTKTCRFGSQTDERRKQVLKKEGDFDS